MFNRIPEDEDVDKQSLVTPTRSLSAANDAAQSQHNQGTTRDGASTTGTVNQSGLRDFDYAIVGPRLHRNGWSTMPGYGKKALLLNWQQYNTRMPTEEEIEASCRTYLTYDTALLTGGAAGTVAVDCDVLNLKLSAYIFDIADEIFSVTPAKRIGLRPKWLGVYRGSGIRSCKPHPIEIFADSGYIVAYGIHPDTLQPYKWIDRELFDLTPADLPLVTQEMIDAFLMEAARVVESCHPRTGRRVDSGGSGNRGIFKRLQMERRGQHGRRWLDTLALQLAAARPGELHDRLISVVDALVARGYSDRAIHKFIDEHFSAPRSGPYGEVWNQIDAAIQSARMKFDRPVSTTIRLAAEVDGEVGHE